MRRQDRLKGAAAASSDRCCVDEIVADALAVTCPMTLRPPFSIASAKLTVTMRPSSTSNEADVKLV